MCRVAKNLQPKRAGKYSMDNGWLNWTDRL
jgi:hypothetical protein